MGHQISFFAAPDDIIDMEKVLRRIEPLTIFHARSPSAKPRVVPSLDARQGDLQWWHMYLVREQDVQEVVTEHVPAQGYWTIDVLRSPVVEVARCYFDEKALRRGRLYYVDGYYSEQRLWVEKSNEFRAWASKVLRAARKKLTRHGAFYAGEHALQWLSQSGGRFVN